jgi:hypothetical protein
VYGYFIARVGIHQLVDENLYARYIIRSQHFFYSSQMTPRSWTTYLAFWRLQQWYGPALLWGVLATLAVWALSRRRRLPLSVIAAVIGAGPAITLYQAVGAGLMGWGVLDFYPWAFTAIVIAVLLAIRRSLDRPRSRNAGGPAVSRCPAAAPGSPDSPSLAGWGGATNGSVSEKSGRAARGRKPSSEKEATIALLIFSGLPLLVRMLGNPAIQFYGNLLIWPTAIVYLYVLFDVLPRAAALNNLQVAKISAGVFYACLAAIGILYLHHDIGLTRYRNFTVHGDAGIIRTDTARGAVFQDVVNLLHREGGSTLLAAPEDAFLYVMTSRISPLPYTHLIPGHVSDPEHETQAIQTLEAHPPDHVVLVRRDVYEYFPPTPPIPRFFGIDYNRDLYRWITTHYTRIARFERGDHWAEVYRRRSAPAQ